MDLLVAADDRTGALETAGALADAGCGVVVVGVDPGGLGSPAVAIVDLGTRHARGAEAFRRCDLADGVAAGHHAHKIDSTLRGGWAGELAHRGRRRRVLVVPALPALGRTCEGGEVLVDGRPVHLTPSGRDVDHAIATSRPAELLRREGALHVVELAAPADCSEWLSGGQGIAVCDASTDAQVDEIARRWALGGSAADVLLAGTSAAIAFGGRHLVVPIGRGPGADRPPLEPPVLVVRGSAHPAAVAQVRRLAEHGAAPVEPGRWTGDVPAGAVTALGAPVPTDVDTVDRDQATAVAAALARAARSALERGWVRTLVVLGGDTAAAVLGAEPVAVGGTLAPGTPWGRVDDDGPLIVTRAGGFGGPDALVELLSATLAP